LSLDVKAVHSAEVEKNRGQTQDQPLLVSGMTQAADQAITFAYEEAYNLSSPSVGAEHILLGLLRLEQHADVDVCKQAGLQLAAVRQIVSNISA
jgi:ATP-dependent Clp protease ATP-binding subunit ClpA